jgi:hypothetical protein
MKGPDGFEINIGLKRERNISISSVELNEMSPFFDIITSVDIVTFTGNINTHFTVLSLNTSVNTVNPTIEPSLVNEG